MNSVTFLTIYSDMFCDMLCSSIFCTNSALPSVRKGAGKVHKFIAHFLGLYICTLYDYHITDVSCHGCHVSCVIGVMNAVHSHESLLSLQRSALHCSAKHVTSVLSIFCFSSCVCEVFVGLAGIKTVCVQENCGSHSSRSKIIHLFV